MIKILVYNTDKIRFPFTVKRKRHGNFQRSTRNTGGDAAAAFAGATAGRRKTGRMRTAPSRANGKPPTQDPPGQPYDARGALRAANKEA